MSEASKPTPGPWAMPDSGQGRVSKVGANGGWDGLIATADCGDYARSKSEGLANARLIAEAGTVHHETGLTPRQLVEQRDALVNALEELISGVLDIRGIDVEEYRPKEFRIARAALALVKGGEK